jgi:hypothetical protein
VGAVPESERSGDAGNTEWNLGKFRDDWSRLLPCNNLGTRTVSVNGVAVVCDGSNGTWPLPALVEGYYYFEFSAGTPDYTSFYWWVQ